MSVPLANRVAGTALALVGIGFAILALQMGIGGLSKPGPGMWPLFASVVLIGAAAVTAFEKSEVDADGAGWKRAVLGCASLVIFLVLFNYLGLIIPGVLIVFFWLKVLSGERALTSAIVAVVMALSAYVLFVSVLGVPIRDVVATVWGG